MLDDEELKEFGKKLKSGLKNNYSSTDELEKEIRQLKNKLEAIEVVNPYV